MFPKNKGLGTNETNSCKWKEPNSVLWNVFISSKSQWATDYILKRRGQALLSSF